jgi:hypothetical protein
MKFRDCAATQIQRYMQEARGGEEADHSQMAEASDPGSR